MDQLNFGMALELLKQGKKVCRAGWNGRGMWLLLVPADRWSTSVGPSHVEGVRAGQRLPWIGMRTVAGEFVPWLASQTDMLAEDWMVASE